MMMFRYFPGKIYDSLKVKHFQPSHSFTTLQQLPSSHLTNHRQSEINLSTQLTTNEASKRVNEQVNVEMLKDEKKRHHNFPRLSFAPSSF